MTQGATSGGEGEWRRHWPLVLTSAVGLAVGSIHFYSTGIFIGPLEQEFGWSRAQISGALTITSIISVFMAPVIGLMIDRWGSRRIALPGMAIYCAAIAALSLAGPSILSWWLGAFFVALGLIGTKTTVWTAAVASRFSKGRGLAFALALCGSGIASALVPFTTNAFLEAFGWRGAYVALGAMGALLALPLILFFFFDAHDDARKARGPRQPVDRSAIPGLSIRQAILSTRFLRLALATFLVTVSINSITAHLVPIMIWGGVGRAEGAAIAGLVGIFSIVGRLTTGFLLDRMSGALIGAVSYLLPIAAVGLLMSFEGTYWQAAAIAAIAGFSVGAEMDVAAYLATRYFGLRHFGVVFGTIGGLISFGSGVGPLISGLVYDHAGGYAPLFLLIAPVFVVASGLVGSLGRYPVFEVPGR